MSKHALWPAIWFWPSIFEHTTHADKRKSKAKHLLLIVPGGLLLIISHLFMGDVGKRSKSKLRYEKYFCSSHTEHHWRC
jgi:hypothetical protein